MTLNEMIELFEKGCTPHLGAGTDAGADYDAVDMSRAPSGEKYFKLTSGGIREIGEPIPAWFVDPQSAIFAWLNEAEATAEERGKQLYWRDLPELVTRTFSMIDAGANVADWRTSGSTSVTMHCVVARLLLSTKDPDGQEVDAGAGKG